MRSIWARTLGLQRLAAVEQGTGCLGVQAVQLQLREARAIKHRVWLVPDGQHERYRVGVQPVRGEGDGLGRRAVEPVRVVHDGQQRAFLGRRRQQVQRGGADQEPARPVRSGAEHALQDRRLRVT